MPLRVCSDIKKVKDNLAWLNVKRNRKENNRKDCITFFPARVNIPKSAYTIIIYLI